MELYKLAPARETFTSSPPGVSEALPTAPDTAHTLELGSISHLTHQLSLCSLSGPRGRGVYFFHSCVPRAQKRAVLRTCSTRFVK